MKTRLSFGVSLASVAASMGLVSQTATAQVRPEQSLAPLPGNRVEAQTPRAPEVFELPITPEVPRSAKRGENVGPSFQLGQIDVTQVTPHGLKPILSAMKIEAIIAPYRNKSITLSEVGLIRDLLSQAIIANGYITSGAEIESFDADKGVLKIKLVRGQLTEVVVKNYGYLSPEYIKARFVSKNDRTVKAETLQSQYQLLLEDRHIASLNAVLKPGTRPGEAVLEIDALKLKSRNAMTVFVASDRSPSVGATRTGVKGRSASVIRTGDELSGEIGKTEGMKEVRLNYLAPLGSTGTQLNLFIQRSNAKIIEEPLNALDTLSSSLYYGGSITKPLIRKPAQSLILSTSLDRLKVKTQLLGQPFSFSPGAVNGVTEYSTLRTHLVYSVYGRKQSFVAGLSITRGIQAQKSTRDVDSDFFKLNASIEYLRVMTVSDQRLVLRAQVQQTTDRLFSTEMLSIGGMDTVRGFRQNSLIGPKGYTASVEYQIPASDLIQSKLPRNHPLSPTRLRADLFADTGHVDLPPGSPPTARQNLSSTGARLTWTPTDHIKVEAHLAKRLNKNIASGTYQDQGLGFNVSYRF